MLPIQIMIWTSAYSDTNSDQVTTPNFYIHIDQTSCDFMFHVKIQGNLNVDRITIHTAKVASICYVLWRNRKCCENVSLFVLMWLLFLLPGTVAMHVITWKTRFANGWWAHNWKKLSLICKYDSNDPISSQICSCAKIVTWLDFFFFKNDMKFFNYLIYELINEMGPWPSFGDCLAVLYLLISTLYSQVYPK